jgi:hypothetical protein
MTDTDYLVKRLRYIPWEKRAEADPLKEEAADTIEALGAQIEVDGQCMAALEREKAAAEADAAKLRAERNNERIWKNAALDILTETGERLTKVEAERDAERQALEARLRDPDQHLIGLIYEVADEEGPEEFYIALADAMFPAPSKEGE